MASMKSWIKEEDIGNMCAHLISDEANKNFRTSYCRRWQC